MCFVIGISTGGPQALSQIFPLLVPPLPPILVVQHMPAQFTGIFAERLNRYSTLPVKQAEEGDPVTSRPDLDCTGGTAHGTHRSSASGTDCTFRPASCQWTPTFD